MDITGNFYLNIIGRFWAIVDFKVKKGYILDVSISITCKMLIVITYVFLLVAHRCYCICWEPKWRTNHGKKHLEALSEYLTTSNWKVYDILIGQFEQSCFSLNQIQIKQLLSLLDGVVGGSSVEDYLYKLVLKYSKSGRICWDRGYFHGDSPILI